MSKHDKLNQKNILDICKNVLLKTHVNTKKNTFLFDLIFCSSM